MKKDGKDFQVGVARRDISPRKPHLLKPTGMDRTEPTRGVLDRVFVEAMAIRIGDELAFLLASDLRYHPHPWVKEIRETVAQKTGCDPWRVLFSATHNHCSSPAAADKSPAAIKAEEEGNQRVRDQYVAACLAAVKDLRPAEIAMKTTHLKEPVGQCRRMRFSSGTCLNCWGSGAIVPPGQKIVGPAGPDSTRVDLLCVREPGRKRPFVLFVSYASHPHMYELPAFSGEFPGAAKRIIQKRVPGALVMQASHTGGDQDIHWVHPMPADPEDKIRWFKRSVRLAGARLADAVVPAIPKSGYHRPKTMRQAFFTTEALMSLPVEERERPINLVGLALDDIAFLSMPGELFHELGLLLHKKSPFAHLFLMGYNGSGGQYLPLPIGFEQGSYEVMSGPSPLPPDGNPLFPLSLSKGARVEAAKAIIDRSLEVFRKMRRKK